MLHTILPIVVAPAGALMWRTAKRSTAFFNARWTMAVFYTLRHMLRGWRDLLRHPLAKLRRAEESAELLVFLSALAGALTLAHLGVLFAQWRNGTSQLEIVIGSFVIILSLSFVLGFLVVIVAPYVMPARLLDVIHSKQALDARESSTALSEREGAAATDDNVVEEPMEFEERSITDASGKVIFTMKVKRQRRISAKIKPDEDTERLAKALGGVPANRAEWLDKKG